MQGTAGAAAGSNGEILLALLHALLLVGACNRMLETGGVGGVSGDGNVNALFPHDRNALGYIIGAVAVYLCAQAVGVGLSPKLLHLAGVVIHLSLYICKSVDTGND